MARKAIFFKRDYLVLEGGMEPACDIASVYCVGNWQELGKANHVLRDQGLDLFTFFAIAAAIAVRPHVEVLGV
jgi:hypothetical protein